eukprot:symbB.v1.2.021846.t2/scaffold1913.1/size122320/2
MATEEWRQQWIEAVSKIRSDVSYDQSVKLNWEAKLDASKCSLMDIDIPDVSLEDVLPANSVHEVKMATSWLLRMGTKAREPAIIIGELKFTWGHCLIVFCGLFVLGSTLYMLLAADADQRKIKSASIRHILMATPQDIALAKNRLDQGEAGLQLRGNFRSGGESFEQMPFCIRWWRSGSLSARRT